MVFVFFGAGAVHVAWIPFAAEGGDAVNAPVDEDAELGVFVPVGDFVFLQGLPVGAVGTLRADAARFFHERGALRIVFCAGVLPGLIDGFGVLGTRGLGLRG